MEHHLSEHFIETPNLASNNGAGYGATIFLDYDKMIEYLKEDGRTWHICELDLCDNYVDYIFDNTYMVKLLESMSSKLEYFPLNLDINK